MQTSTLLTHISDPVQSRSSLGWSCCGSRCCRCCGGLWHCGGRLCPRGGGGRCGGCGGHFCGWGRHRSCLMLFADCVPCRNIDMSLWLDVGRVWTRQQQHSMFKATQKLAFSSGCPQAPSHAEPLVPSLWMCSAGACVTLCSQRVLTAACCSINAPPTLFCFAQEHLSN